MKIFSRFVLVVLALLFALSSCSKKERGASAVLCDVLSKIEKLPEGSFSSVGRIHQQHTTRILIFGLGHLCSGIGQAHDPGAHLGHKGLGNFEHVAIDAVAGFGSMSSFLLNSFRILISPDGPFSISMIGILEISIAIFLQAVNISGLSANDV